MHNFCRFVWQYFLDSMQTFPSITELGYTELYRPLWTNIPEASKALTLLKHCNCKKGCKDRSSFKATGLKCTELCFCQGQCWKHCCVLESTFYKFHFLITVNHIVKHQLTKACSKLAIEASEKLRNFNDVIFERPHFLLLLLLILDTF